jgi:hypothetical protein
METINFQPGFDYIDQKTIELKEELASKEDIKKLQISLDTYAKQSKDYYQEVTVLVAKVSRMENWIRQASTKLGIEYQV